MSKLYEFEVTTSDGRTINLAEYQDKTLLIVNVASLCSFTEQYAELERLYQEFKGQGFVILAFPCNQFGNQEPGSNKNIQRFCVENYQVSFPILAKIEVNGQHAHPLFQFLTVEVPGVLGTRAIKWNFTKFLIDKQGKCIRRYAPITKPSQIHKDIIAIL